MNRTPTLASEGLLFLEEEPVDITQFELLDPSQLHVVEDGPLAGTAWLPPLPVVSPDGRIWINASR